MRYFELFILLTLFSCHNVDKKGNRVEQQNFISEKRLKTTELIATSIDLPALQQYFGVQKTLNQNELVILQNEFTEGLDSLNKFSNPVKILSISDINGNGIKAYLEFKQVKISNDTAFVYYRYDIQGVGIKSTYLYKTDQWHLLDYNLWEN